MFGNCGFAVPLSKQAFYIYSVIRIAHKTFHDIHKTTNTEKLFCLKTFWIYSNNSALLDYVYQVIHGVCVCVTHTFTHLLVGYTLCILSISYFQVVPIR